MKKIIVVDDDPGIQDTVGLILENEGYEVVVFANGNHLVRNNFDHPDLILLDKLLPGIDGLDICRHLKQNPDTRPIPIIIMSASPHIGEAAHEAGAEGFLEKPFKLKELLDLVRMHVR